MTETLTPTPPIFPPDMIKEMARAYIDGYEMRVTHGKDGPVVYRFKAKKLISNKTQP